MANGWNSDSDREAMLRRVAIVLSSLPAPTANRLLGTMGDSSKQAVRRTMTTLADVDPLERQRALQAFRVSIDQQPSEAAPPAQRSERTSRVMASAQVEVSSEPASSIATDQVAPDSPLGFLGDVDDDTLVALMTVEHPQTIALVLASIAPAQAARVLPRLQGRQRSDTLSRLGRLGEVPEAAAAEVAEHFRSRLANLNHVGHAPGRRALDAILAAMPGEISDPVEPDRNDVRSNARQSLGDVSVNFPSADRPAMDLSQKLRQAMGDAATTETTATESLATERTGISADANVEHTEPELRVVRDDSVDRRAMNVDEALTSAINPTHSDIDASILGSTDSIHQYLLSLIPIELCQALGRVETRDAMLTLCGLPNEVTEAALAVLPRAQAKKVRSSMNGLGSLQLREIDEAKERVARASLAAKELAIESMPIAA